MVTLPSEQMASSYVGPEDKKGNQDGGRAPERGGNPPRDEGNECAERSFQTSSEGAKTAAQRATTVGTNASGRVQGSSGNEVAATEPLADAQMPQDESLDTVFNRRDVKEIERRCREQEATETPARHVFDIPSDFFQDFENEVLEEKIKDGEEAWQ